MLRAKIVLATAEGRENKDIAEESGYTRRTVGIWRNHFAADCSARIEKDAPRPGRRAVVREEKEAEIIRKTTQETPTHATQWSVKTMAKVMGVSKDTARGIWRDSVLTPHRTKSFKVYNDPHSVDKPVDVVGLYLYPPEHALVLSCDEKSQIQALDRTQNRLPLFPGRLKTMTQTTGAACVWLTRIGVVSYKTKV